MRFGKFKNSLGIVLLTATSVLLSGCDTALLDPKGQIGLEQRSLILTAFGLMLIVVIPVLVMTVMFARKYRASNTNAKYTPDWSHSGKLEFIVWAVPIIIITILAVITWKTTHDLDPYKPLKSDVKPVRVDVVSLDWKWLFIYPDLGIATVNELAFPVNTPVNFRITSNSVMNSFFIPQLGSQIYSMPGMQTQLHLIANEPGEYKGISSNYSGSGFSGMKFTAIATPDNAAFEQWVAKVKQSPNTLNSMEQFETLAKPSEFHPVEYFSSAKPDLMIDVIHKFMGEDMNMDASHHEQTMDMGEHAAPAGAEE